MGKWVIFDDNMLGLMESKNYNIYGLISRNVAFKSYIL